MAERSGTGTDWSETMLQRIYAAYRQPYGWPKHAADLWPYDGGTDLNRDTFLQAVVADLERSETIIVEADFNSYGSGYASFVDIFCTKRDGSARRPYLGSGEIAVGIRVYVSRLVPVAAYGSGEIRRHAHGGSYGFLEYGTVGTTPYGDWSGVVEEVCTKLKAHGLEVADAETLRRTLPFEADIATSLGDQPYRIFDLVFNWDD